MGVLLQHGDEGRESLEVSSQTHGSKCSSGEVLFVQSIYNFSPYNYVAIAIKHFEVPGMQCGW